MGTTTMNTTNTDLRPAASGARRPASPIRPGLLPHALFVAELLATRRAGRCLADIEFTSLSCGEANAWLAAHGRER